MTPTRANGDPRRLRELATHLQPCYHDGHGTFTCGSRVFSADFRMVRYPLTTEFLIEGRQVRDVSRLISGPGYEPWSLMGHLSDGRQVECSELLATRVRVSLGPEVQRRATLTPLRCVTVGTPQSRPPASVQYPLVGYYEGPFSLEHDGWAVSASSPGTGANVADRLRKGWGLLAQGLTLRLSGKAATLEDYERTARHVTDLLSLASGTGVTFHRYTVKWDNGDALERLGRGARDQLGPGPCVPSFAAQQFAEHALPAFSEWPQEKQDLFRLAVGHMILSGSGYLETRFMSIWQAWEILGKEWGPKAALTREEAALKAAVRQAYETWCQVNPDADPKGGELWGRLAFAFRWLPALRRLGELADKGRLDRRSIGLDFRDLKRARDSVAHTGRIPDDLYADRKAALRLLDSARFGLQLLLLAELAYTGLVETEENGWRTFVRIDELLLKTT